MKLRESIRPPERYESENFYSPMSRRPLRQLKPQVAPSYIDFNPNLPPAAFPTLNYPRPAIPSTNGEDEQSSAGTSPYQPCGQSGHHGGAIANNGTRADFEVIPANQIENHMASNGNMNPVYVQNMATMAAAGTSSTDIDMDSSETDAVEHYDEPMYSIRDPKWKDLSRGIQVEIFDNILQRYTWSSASHLLGLSIQEQNELEENLSARDDQMKREDLQLVDMRRKQLRALLRIDNSSRRKQDSARFVFRKISRDSTRSLEEKAKPEYLVCDATEVANARRYLHQHGVDPRYVGEWSSSIATDQHSRGDQEPDMSILKEQLASGLCTDLATSIKPSDDHKMDLTDDGGTLSTLNKLSFINTIGTASTASVTEMALCRGNLTAAPSGTQGSNASDVEVNTQQCIPAFAENHRWKLVISYFLFYEVPTEIGSGTTGHSRARNTRDAAYRG
ncbi:hypothetical protein BBP40_000084 [Aspergillus hancockii]|nr:hypothetical protein BBP40_000084 [Aspergillus hancockii]